MTYVFESGDYIRFNRIYRGESPVRFRTDYATGRPIAEPQIPEQVLPQSGGGQILKLAKEQKKVRNLQTNEMERFWTARVASGNGVVTAILDDATLEAKPMTMFDIAPVDPDQQKFNQYGGDGIA